MSTSLVRQELCPIGLAAAWGILHGEMIARSSGFGRAVSLELFLETSKAQHLYHHLRSPVFHQFLVFIRVVLTSTFTTIPPRCEYACPTDVHVTDPSRLPLRQAAARLLTTRSVSIATRPRNITTFASLPSRPSRFSAPTQLQRRWASGEAEAKKEDEVPISQLQPTPQEEVENAIHEDHAGGEATNAGAQTATKPPMAESSNLTEATDDATTTATEPEAVRETVDRAPSPRDAAATLTEGITNRGTMDARKPFREPATPKPTVYVGNLFFDVTENDLAKEFSRYGEVKRTRLIRDARGLSKGSVVGMILVGSPLTCLIDSVTSSSKPRSKPRRRSTN